MKNFLYKKLVMFLIVLLPIIEIIFGDVLFFNLSIDTIIRFLVLILLFGYLIIGDKSNKKFNYIYLTFVLLFCSLNLFNNMFVIKIRFFEYFAYLLKYVYHLILILFIVRFVQNNVYKFHNYGIRIPTLIVSAFCFVNFFINSGYDDYSLIRDNFVWLNNIAYQLSDLLGLLFPICCYNAFFNKDGIFLDKVLVILSGCSLLMFENNFSLLIFYMILSLYLIYRLIFIRKKKIDSSFILSLVLIISVTLLYNYLPVVNKYETYLKYYKENNIRELITRDYREEMDAVEKKQKDIDYYDRFIGKSFINGKTSHVLTTEYDIYDLFFMNGIVGLSLFIFLYAYVCYLFSWRSNYKGIKRIGLFVGSCLTLCIIFMISKNFILSYASSYFILCIGSIFVNKVGNNGKKNLLVSSKSAFVERLDANKYNITYLVTDDNINKLDNGEICYPYFDNFKLLNIKFFRKIFLNRFMLRNLIRNKQYDIIISDNSLPFVDNYYLAKSFGKKKVVVGKKKNKYFKESISKMDVNNL